MDTVKICRLCLNRIYDNDFELSEDYISQMLEQLFMDVNIGISADPVICRECEVILRDFHNFKLKCLSNLKDIKENSTLELEEALCENKDIYADNISGVQEICRFCRKVTNYEFTQLYDTKENIFIVSMLQKHTPELNLNTTEQLIACKYCFEALKRFYAFITRCVEVEEKINNYVNIEGINKTDYVQLNKVANLIYNDDAVKVKDSYVKCEKLGSSSNEIKSESLLGENNLDVGIKSEEISLKMELINSDGKDTAASGNPNIIHQNPGVTMLECDICPYKSKFKKHLRQHLLRHSDLSELNTLRCQLCTFTTRFSRSLVRHQIVHKSPSEIMCTRTFKCDFCSYIAKRKSNLNQHMLRHKSPTETTMYKCTECAFTTKHRNNIGRHSIIHKNPSEVSLFKCDKCSHVALRSSSLKRHMLNHKDLSEVTLLECDQCSYKSKHKDNLRNHVLRVHRDPAEVTVFKCGVCLYQATKLIYLKRHMFKHKTLPELTSLKSNETSCIAGNKDNSIQQMRVYKGPAEVKIFKCDLCPYVGTKRSNLKRHVINHKSLSEVTLLECYNCSYKTRHKDNLVKHMLIHKDLS